MGAKKEYPADSGEPIAVWSVDIDCAHEDECACEDDTERGVWVDTRVASDTLARGALVLALREYDDDDGDDVVRIDDRIAVSCDLATGALTPLRTEGAIFLNRHPWLEEVLREEELPRLRLRAERAAAQGDRETAAKRALPQPGNAMLPYHELFPADWDLLPVCDGERYWAVDLYCRNPDCTCTSSVIRFHRVEDDATTTFAGEVTVDYAEAEPRARSTSPGAARVFERLWKESEYSLRARQAEASSAVRRLASRTKTPVAAVPVWGRTPRNAPCPCGSGKKFKRCCLDSSARDDIAARR
ncbi:MAG: SEC-C domain-containing protein [Labilithrix sp.]|nr:SEC-C domain-containing protein [Labilithrix sp.]